MLCDSMVTMETSALYTNYNIDNNTCLHNSVLIVVLITTESVFV